MIHENNLETRQKDELNVLKSMYGHQLKDLRKKKAAWNRWQPLNFSLSLRPQQGDSANQEAHVSVDLHVICSEQYPLEPPKLQFENPRGLSDIVLFKLKEELDKMASDMKGEEMIHLLANHVEVFLYEHNKPVKKSFYDQMMEKKREEELKAQEALQQENDRNKVLMQEEIFRRRSEQNKHITFNDSLEDGVEESNESSDSTLDLSASSRRYKCEHSGMKTIEFHNSKRIVKRGSCIKHISERCVVYLCLDEHCTTLYLMEWTINKTEVDSDIISAKMTGIQQEVTSKLTQLSHHNLCTYIDVQNFEDANCIYIYLLSEYVQGINCAMLMNKIYPCDLQLMRHITQGVTSALLCLHRNDIVHKDLNLSCIHLRESDSTIKVSNYSIYKRICDLICPPANGHLSYSKKGDIYKLGVLLVALWTKSSVNEENVTVPFDMPYDFGDFIRSCINKKENRPSILELLEHKFLRDEVLSFLPRRSDPSPERSREQIKELQWVLNSKIQVSKSSRILSEFDVLEQLGKGGFGYVFKARNKLDGNCYAVKVIKLKARNITLIKKIVREVKLLSRLHHENIVRYYNSWIEAATTEDTLRVHPQSKLTFVSSDEKQNLEVHRGGTDVVVVTDCKSESLFQTSVVSDEEDDNEDDDGDDVNFNACGKAQSRGDDSDDFIEFEEGEQSRTEYVSEKTTEDAEESNLTESMDKNCQPLTKAVAPNSKNKEQYKNLIQNLYIQMEFCEKSTLRTAIEDNLYKNQNKVWMLFREIVEGIAYIHEQGMMHRDLKPDNIFLDSKGHIKIGDFGLATHIVSRRIEGARNESDGEYPEDERKTGAVGTSLYIAPELNNVAKVSYNEKVDIYSLGIILFEMWHPFDTKMERFETITALRSKDIIFPKEFERKDTEKQRLLIRWLLNHDSTKRPTSHELLKSEHLPPPEREEEEMKEFIKHTVKNPQSKHYKFLISSCFGQDVTPADDVMYDHDQSLTVNISSLHLHEQVQDIITNVFKQYGGVKLSTPFPMPKCNFYLYGEKDPYVKLMSHDGVVVSLPHDLRIPFARYIAWQGLKSFRRYSIERVFKHKHKIVKFKPLETWECSFDIVTPSNSSFIPDAEILYVAYEILCALKVESNCWILLNHTSLFEAILNQYNIVDQKDALITFFNEVQEGTKQKSGVKDKLSEFGLSVGSVSTLTSLFNDKFYFTRLPSILQQMKKSRKVGKETKKALEQLEAIVDIVREFGDNIHIALAPGVLYQANHFDGMMCQVVCHIKKKHACTDVIASGGRYDAAVAHYIDITKKAGIHPNAFDAKAVGIIFSLDKLCNIIQMEAEERKRANVVDIIICSVGTNEFIREKVNIMKSLRSAGINCYLFECENDDELLNHCLKSKTRLAILLSEQGAIKIRVFEKERFYDGKAVKMSDLVDRVQNLIRPGNQQDSGQSSLLLSRSDSRTSTSERMDQTTSPSTVIHFIEKLQSHQKKRLETQMKMTLEKLLMKFKNTVIIALNCDTNLVNLIATQLNLVTEESYQTSLRSLSEKQSRQRRDLEDICQEIYSQNKKYPDAIIILYSYKEKENYYKVLLNN